VRVRVVGAKEGPLLALCHMLHCLLARRWRHAVRLAAAPRPRRACGLHAALASHAPPGHRLRCRCLDQHSGR
jgi:hypothetical protein